MANLPQAFSAGKVPMIGVLVVGIIVLLIDAFARDFNFISLLSTPLNFLLFAYAGYAATRGLKQDIVTAGLAAALASVLAGAVLYLLTVIFLVAGLSSASHLLPSTGVTDLLLFTVDGFVGLLLTAIVNFIVGIIGGYAGQKM